MKLYVGQGLVVLGLAMGLAACGPKLQSVSEQDGSMAEDPARRETISIGVDVSERGAGFRLAGTTSFLMTMDGCKSGLTYPNISQNNPSIQVYKFDQGCKVKLVSFVLNGITYQASAGDSFGTYAVGDSALFEESPASSNKLNVRVANQLGATITGTEPVSYTFTQVLAGQDEVIARSVVGDSHSLSVSGIDAANVDITGVTMTGMTNNGAGQFTFAVECKVAISGSSPDRMCGTNKLTEMKYKLIEDTTANGTLNYSEAEALFASNAGTLVSDGLIFTTGNGGFNTVILDGPDAMHAHPNMILVIQSGSSSYRYFNVDVTTLVYPTPALQ